MRCPALTAAVRSAACAVVLGMAVSAYGQSAALPAAFAAGAVQSTDASGHVTLRAVRLTGAIKVDGVLDEATYRDVPAISNFIQVEPQQGPPATQKTEVWILFDNEAIYVTFRCWESDLDRMIADEMRRDSMNITNQEFVGFSFDTFKDRRNGFAFNVTPLGAFMDGQVTDERSYNGDWNPVWLVKAGRFEGGWTVEVRMPFKSLRYPAGAGQEWGMQLRRENKWKNEISYVTAIPRTFAMRGMMAVSTWATLVGLEVPPTGVRLDVKPYVTGSLSTDRVARPPVSNRPDGDFGVDARWGVTGNLSADLTYNTDFAQVEADEQQVNLTRFSLFFPEKREFFLENQGIFAFGGAGGVLGASSSDTPTMFYSRRIGLGRGQVVPIRAGGRLTGRAGPFVIGLIDIQSDDAVALGLPSTNFGVARIKRDLLRRSSIGAMATYRSRGEAVPGQNTMYGVDTALTFFKDVFASAYWARTEARVADTSYRAQLDWSGDRWGLQAERLYVGPAFDPGVGFVRRPDMAKTQALFRFSPRPGKPGAVRKYTYQVSGSSTANSRGRIESEDLTGQFGVEFQNGDRLSTQYNHSFEYLPRPFAIAAGVTLPVADYAFDDVQASFTFTQQRRLSGTLAVQAGAFYNGTIRSVAFTGGRFEFSRQFSIEPSTTFNWVALPAGDFTTRLVGSRITFTMTPRMFASALVQYNSAGRSLGTNVRFRWEYTPGSEVFLVYNDQRDTLRPGVPELMNRSLIFKTTRLIRF
jgi:hypothetical protein